jgi:hypothetical protein
MFDSTIIKAFGILFVVVIVWLFLWAFWYEPDSLTVQSYDTKVKDWNPELNGYRIVLISDVHGGSNWIDEKKIREVVREANAQNPDLIVLLGDYVSQQYWDRTRLKMPMKTVADNLAGLRAKNGVFAVIGNHDLWYSKGTVRQELERVGYKVLEQEAVVIESKGVKFTLLGLREALEVDTWKNFSTTAKYAVENVSAIKPIIALEHNPDVFPIFQANPIEGLNLMLAGHTHGGQCNFPFIGAPIVPATKKYTRGLIEENGLKLFVTTGIGTSIFPVRFRVPPEISVVNLYAE